MSTYVVMRRLATIALYTFDSLAECLPKPEPLSTCINFNFIAYLKYRSVELQFNIKYVQLQTLHYHTMF